MAIIFPSSPSPGDIFTSNGKSWQYVNGKWESYGETVAPDVFAVDAANDVVHVYGSLSAGASASIGTDLEVSGDLTVDTNTFHVDSTNNRVGIGTTTPQSSLGVDGDIDMVGTSRSIVYGRQSEAGPFGLEIVPDGSLESAFYYRSNSNTWRFEDGSDNSALTVDPINMRVGISTTSPSELLDVDAGTSGSVSLTTSGGRTIQLTANDSDPFLSVGSTTAHSASIMTNGIRRIIVLDDGKVGIGRSTPEYALDVNGDAQIANSGTGDLWVKTNANSSQESRITIGGARTASSDDNLSQLRFWNYANQSTGGDYEAARISAVDPSASYSSGNGALVFKTSSGGSLSEGMRLDENGVLIFGDTSVPSGIPTNGLFLYADTGAGTSQNGMWIDGDTGSGDDAFVIGDRNNHGTILLQILGDGDVENVSGNYGVISDETTKQDIVDAQTQWDDIKNLRLRNYRLIRDVERLGDDAPVLLGVVAQEVEAAGMGGLVANRDNHPKSVKQSILYMKAVGALQEAMGRIETLESTNAELTARIEALESAP